MITGIVNADREAVIQLHVTGANGQPYGFEAVIDTGFTSFLTLPAAVIAAMGFAFAGYQQAELANGSIEQVAVYNGFIDWDGQQRFIEIASAETQPLVGMSLLYGYKLTVEAIDGGLVTIEHLANP
jgi:clan AA aspartic protease